MEEVTLLENAVVRPDEMCRPQSNNHRRVPKENNAGRNWTDQDSCRGRNSKLFTYLINIQSELIIINLKLLAHCCNYPQNIADLQDCMRHLLLPLTEPRSSSRRMKKGRKDTKLQSLPRKPTGTCMDAGQSPRAQPPPARLVPAAFFLCPGRRGNKHSA